jgi:hypothetical protein
MFHPDKPLELDQKDSQRITHQMKLYPRLNDTFTMPLWARTKRGRDGVPLNRIVQSKRENENTRKLLLRTVPIFFATCYHVQGLHLKKSINFCQEARLKWRIFLIVRMVEGEEYGITLRYSTLRKTPAEGFPFGIKPPRSFFKDSKRVDQVLFHLHATVPH